MQGGKQFQLQRAELLQLRPRQWLTDPVVNLYLECERPFSHLDRADGPSHAPAAGPFAVLQHRSEAAQGWPAIHCLNSSFYNRLCNSGGGGGGGAERNYNYEYVRTWTRRVDLFSKGLVIIPVSDSTRRAPLQSRLGLSLSDKSGQRTLGAGCGYSGRPLRHRSQPRAVVVLGLESGQFASRRR